MIMMSMMGASLAVGAVLLTMSKVDHERGDSVGKREMVKLQQIRQQGVDEAAKKEAWSSDWKQDRKKK